jgi:nucleoside-diphosphate-sugar epimerase
VRGGKVAVIGKGSTRRRPVAVDDVAALVTTAALEADPPTVIEFGGPEAISRNQAIAVAERATGRPMKRRRMPGVAARLGMRLLARRNDALASVFGAGLHQDRVEARWDDAPLRERGIAARSATEFIQEQARFSEEQARE